MIEFNLSIFARFLCSFGQPSSALVGYHRERSRVPLQDAVGVNCAKGANTGIKEHVPSIWAKPAATGWMLDNQCFRPQAGGSSSVDP